MIHDDNTKTHDKLRLHAIPVEKERLELTNGKFHAHNKVTISFLPLVSTSLYSYG